MTLLPEPTGSRRPLLTPLPTPGHFLLVTDNSSMEKFTTCPQSARNYLVLGREARAKNAALTFGGAVHAGLEVLLKGPTQVVNSMQLADGSSHWSSSSPNAWRMESDAEFRARQDLAIVNHFAAHPTPPDEYRTPATALEVLRHYRSKCLIDPGYEWEILADTEGPLVERAFELPLGTIELDTWVNGNYGGQGMGNIPQTYIHTIHLAWSGRIDAIVRANGKVRVVDHKTTSVAGDNFVQEFAIRNQTLGYVWAARQLWPDLDVSGFLLNAIHLKRPTGNASRSLVEPGPRGGDAPLSFFRAYFDYSLERLRQWELNAQAIVSDFVHNLVRDYHPLATSWCVGKFGRCPYHDACTIDDLRVRDNYLMSDAYTTVTWNPVRA